MSPRILAASALAAVLPVAGGAQERSFEEVQEYACESGELPSCTLLGLVYETGAAGERDPARALELYDHACDGGVMAACLRLELAPDPAEPPPDLEEGYRRLGLVADLDTGEPLPGAIVSVESLGVRVVADQSGYVDLGTLPPGDHEIVVRRGDYLTVEGALPVPWERQFLLLMQRTRPPSDDDRLGRIVGRVTDPSGAGLAGVAVLVPGEDSQLRAVTNADGRFALDALEPGTFELRFVHLGFQERSTTVRVAAGTTMEVQARLAMAPIALEPIEVTVGSAYLQRSGFYRRLARNPGTTLTRADIARIDPITVADLFVRVPGVTVESNRAGARLYTTRARFTDGGRC
ncbi:MAG TPA: carboxypeptidase regulatory-like domain-containing protein, partial [Longimicrobiales bacterium]|nr:carboxypeptidase regulatory-like domain-containing protein [Longimicrobiales bacterium]